jgi:hypothetical protein
MIFFRHKLTGSLLALKSKKENANVAIYYVLNEDKTHKYSNAGFSTPNKKRKKLAICLNANVEEVKV